MSLGGLTGRNRVAEVSKKWFRVADTHGVDIAPGADGELAGVALVVGLYAALAVMMGYALFDSSRQLKFGPEHFYSTVSTAVQTFLEHKGKYARKSGERD